MTNELSKKEMWSHIEKLESSNRESKAKSEESKRKHEKRAQKLNNISNAMTACAAIFNPFVLLSLKDNDGEKK